MAQPFPCEVLEEDAGSLRITETARGECRPLMIQPEGGIALRGERARGGEALAIGELQTCLPSARPQPPDAAKLPLTSLPHDEFLIESP